MLVNVKESGHISKTQKNNLALKILLHKIAGIVEKIGDNWAVKIISNFFFRKQYPDRKVNSIYFDDINYSSILENLDGVSSKKKIRVRWYGSQNKLINPILEIKSKKGFVTKKENYQI